jgi:hypothetical protein
MQIRDMVVTALFIGFFAVIPLRYYLTGNDSGACASVTALDDRLEVNAGGGLFSLAGVWFILIAAAMGRAAVSMFSAVNANTAVYIIGAVLGAFSCLSLFEGIKWLFERRNVLVDGLRQEVLSTYRLIVTLKTLRFLISDFDKISLASRSTGSGKTARTCYKVRMEGPSSGVDLDCDAILDYEIARSLADSAARITNLPVENRVQ